MKISLIGPVTPYRGGIAQFTTLLAQYLEKSGHDVQVISFKKQYPKWLYPGKSDKDYSPGRENVDANFVLRPLNPISWVKTVQRIAKFTPEKIIVSWWVTFWAPAFSFISRRLRKKGFDLTFLIHNTLPHEPRFFDKWLTSHTLRHANRFIVMTKKEKQRLLAELPSSTNIDIVSLPIFHASPPSGFTTEEIKKRLNLPPDDPVLLFFGFIRPYKGLSVLLQSLKELHEKGIPAHLLVVGEFWHDKQIYIDQINALEMTKFVRLEDKYVPDDEVSAFFEISDVFVAPYINGTQSASLKLALGYGVPAVVTEPAADELTHHLQGLCKIVPANDSRNLSKAIAEQLSRPQTVDHRKDDIINNSWNDIVKVVEKPVSRDHAHS